MANHTVINTSGCAFQNVDAFVHTGIYANADVDNGTLLTLTSMNTDSTSKAVKGYEWTVGLQGANAAVGDELWIACTGELNRDIDSVYSDLRTFTNKAGVPILMGKVLVGDIIEITAEAFGTNDFPEASEIGYFIPTAANGKFGTPVQNAPAYACFKAEGFGNIECGGEDDKSVFLRRIK